MRKTVLILALGAAVCFVGLTPVKSEAAPWNRRGYMSAYYYSPGYYGSSYYPSTYIASPYVSSYYAPDYTTTAYYPDYGTPVVSYYSSPGVIYAPAPVIRSSYYYSPRRVYVFP
jgi:hypothetical protein